MLTCQVLRCNADVTEQLTRVLTNTVTARSSLRVHLAI